MRFPGRCKDHQMDEEREDPMLRSPTDIIDRTGSMEGAKDQKGKLCSVQEDNLGTSSTKKRRNRKGGACNLRKSLAWNQAFYTEEGVLDQMELSFLNKSSTKSMGCRPLVSEMSPFTMYNKSSVRPPLHDVVTNSRSKDTKMRRLFSLSNEGPEPHMTPGRTPPAKSTFRGVPRSPDTYSQRRVVNASTVNPTSKLPKFMPTKPHVPPSSSRNAMLTTRSSKSDQSAHKASIGQNGSVRQPHAKMDFACSSSSSKFSANDDKKNTVKSCSANLKEIPNCSSSAKYDIVTCGSGEVASLIPQCINHVGGPSALVHARPSALRMPSPSLGFFCQGKVSPSSNYQHQRYTQPAESKFPSLRHHMNLKQNLQLRTLTTLAGQQPTKCTTAGNFRPAAAVSTSSQASLPESCSKSSTTHDTYCHIETNTEMKQHDGSNRKVSITSENSCLDDTKKQSIYDCLLVVQGSQKLPGVLPLKKPDPGSVKELDCGDSSSKISNESFDQVIQQFPRANVPKNACDANRLAIDSNGIRPSCSNESQDCREECDSKEIQDSSWVDNLARNLDDKVIETYPVTIENNRSDKNSNIDPNLGSEFTPISVAFDDSSEDKFSLKEDVAGSYLTNSLELNRSLSPSSGICGQLPTIGNVCMTSNDTLANNCQPTHFDEMEIQEHVSHCDSNATSTRKSDSSMSRDRMCQGTSRQNVLLNVVPFSDEWVAALESLGEDILEKKTGPVQNSPQDKALPEPGPWSPVKKAQDIGPCDCTKYTKNATTSDSH